jgi:hypothetical protein
MDHYFAAYFLLYEQIVIFFSLSPPSAGREKKREISREHPHRRQLNEEFVGNGRQGQAH